MAEKLLTVREVADTLLVSKQTIHRILDQGLMEYVQVGRNFRISQTEFERYIESITKKKEKNDTDRQ